MIDTPMYMKLARAILKDGSSGTNEFILAGLVVNQYEEIGSLKALLGELRAFEDHIERICAMWLAVDDCNDLALTTAHRIARACLSMKVDLQAQLAECRDKAIEEAARVADGYRCGGCGMDGKCSMQIRSLKGAKL